MMVLLQLYLILKKFAEIEKKGINKRMKILIILIVAFLVVMYLISYAKNKKKKENEISSVEEFRMNYIDRREEMKKRREIAQKNSNYITKYNSSEDYREK